MAILLPDIPINSLSSFPAEFHGPLPANSALDSGALGSLVLQSSIKIGGYALGFRLPRVEAFRFPQASGLGTTALGHDPLLSYELQELDSSVPSGVLTTQPFETLYDALGRRQGSLATRDFRSDLQRVWASTGSVGATWLCERLRREVHVERQSDAISALVAIGDDAVQPILDTLQLAPGELQAEALLEALRWIGLPDREEPRLRWLVRRYLEHRSTSVRIAAVKAAACLTRSPASDLLRQARALEEDLDVLAEIDERLNA